MITRIQKRDGRAEEYVESVTNSFSASGSVSSKFINACSNYGNETFSQIKHKRKVSFQNIVETCETLLSPFNGKLLILFDEIGSTSKTFFKNQSDGDSYFETLMNQLRTLPYVRTKLAVYPHSYSDILMETRYGDIIELEYDTTNNIDQYRISMEKTVSLIERYIEKSGSQKYNIEEFFEISANDQLIIEHLVNASSGNMRRLVHILDSTMDSAYRRTHGKQRVSIDDLINALKKQGLEMENRFQDEDKLFLSKLVKLCRNRSTYNFTFSNKSAYIWKYTSLSSEYNIINIRQAGAGRKKTVYSFDYAYCIYQDIPTHYIKNSEKIDKTRSTLIGEPIKRVAQLSDELLIQSEIKGKVEAEITYVSEEGRSGFAKCTDNGISYFITLEKVISPLPINKFYLGKKILLLPMQLSEDTFMAYEIEIL